MQSYIRFFEFKINYGTFTNIGVYFIINENYLKLYKSGCKYEVSISQLIILYIFVSSAYNTIFQYYLLCIEDRKYRLYKKRNTIGDKWSPCGTPE